MMPIIKEFRVEYTRNLKWKHAFKCPYCPNEFTAIGADVNSGRTKSCGCYGKKMASDRKKHGLNKTPEHRAWVEMKRRCLDENRPAYKNYGGRGITFCNEWLEFTKFIADMGSKPSPDYSLDRIDNDLGYYPENCRWADRKTQSRNQRRHAGKKWLP